MRFRRLIQGVSLLLFLGLLVFPPGTGAGGLRTDLFLRMDPLAVLALLRSGQASFGLLLPGLAVIVLTLALGRLFCSTLCPLGATIDLSDRLFKRLGRRVRPRAKGRPDPDTRAWKYLVLAFAAGSILAGSSLVLLVSPLSLATRFYGLIALPVLASFLNLGASLARGAGSVLGIGALEYLTVPVHGYSLVWTTAVLMAFVLGLGVLAPRFWCRFLCPSGALLSLLSFGRRLKREVSDACTGCGVCTKACPMGAVADAPAEVKEAECISCGECGRVCPKKAVTFHLGLWDKAFRNGPHGDGEGAGDFKVNGAGGEPGFSRPRRDFLLAGITGAGGAAFALALPGGMGAGGSEGRAVRPPGALPERSFLSACIRCGECMAACPTNALQPAGLIAGPAGFLSPVVVARTGPCEPTCTRCGHVCPTGALKALPLKEKVCAKIGTASVTRHRCIAWERGKECLICAEVCPFGAIDLSRTPGVAVAVPFVARDRCNGCGFCEHRCPVAGPSAIFVTPHGALRMEQGSYVSAAREAGLRFEVKQPSAEGAEGVPARGSKDLPPGFEE